MTDVCDKGAGDTDKVDAVMFIKTCIFRGDDRGNDIRLFIVAEGDDIAEFRAADFNEKIAFTVVNLGFGCLGNAVFLQIGQSTLDIFVICFDQKATVCAYGNKAKQYDKHEDQDDPFQHRMLFLFMFLLFSFFIGGRIRKGIFALRHFLPPVDNDAFIISHIVEFG